MVSSFIPPSQILSLLNFLLGVYYYLILARIILSWIVNSYTLEQHPLCYWLCLLTDPLLRLFRRLPFAVLGGVIDISPIFALFAVDLMQRFIRNLAGGAAQGASFAAVLLNMLFQLVRLVLSIAQVAAIVCAVILLFRLLQALFGKHSYNLVQNHIDFYIRKLLDGPLRLLQLQSSKLTMQIAALLVIVVLLAYLLFLSTNLLNVLLAFILMQLP